jgi:Tfp pilus assembly protein PilX
MYKQRGATLIVGLVMLVVLTLLVISAIRSGNTNLRIVGNMQMQEEASVAAIQATEQVISTADFTLNPGVSQVVAIDINMDGTTDYSASVTPVCTGSIALTNAVLDPANAADAPCISSATAQNTGLMVSGVPAAATGTSWCYAQQWELTANVSDPRTGATAETVQGVFMRVPAGTACP